MIEIRQLGLSCGSFALSGLNLSLKANEYAVLMGPTGSGKTSILEAICGLRWIHSGEIWLRGRDVTHLTPAERGVGYVPQDTALFTEMNVGQNLAYGLRMHHAPTAIVGQRVEQVARLLGIFHLLHRRPRGLSGGEARRVALGRAMCLRPDVLMLDEPFAGLDDATREDVYEAIETVHSATAAAVIHVSHDARDAVRLADRLFTLRNGALSETSLANLEKWDGDTKTSDTKTSDTKTKREGDLAPESLQSPAPTRPQQSSSG